MSDPAQEAWNFKVTTAAFGFIGGVLSLAHVKRLTVGWAFLAVLAGMVCAIVFTGWVQEMWALSQPYENGMAFIFGIGGMSVVGKIHDAIERVQIRWILDALVDKLNRNKGK